MPKSRKRKTRRSGGSSRGTYSSNRKSGRRTKTIAVVAIAALATAGVLFAGLFILRGGGSSGGEVTTPSGLKYVDEVVGTGESPQAGQNVTVNYIGTLENGTKFDSSYDSGKPYTFRIGTGLVIQGWDEGLMKMRVGGKRRLIVPPQLAYGAEGRPGIPPNSTLIFEVELLGVH